MQETSGFLRDLLLTNKQHLDHTLHLSGVLLPVPFRTMCDASSNSLNHLIVGVSVETQSMPYQSEEGYEVFSFNTVCLQLRSLILLQSRISPKAGEREKDDEEERKEKKGEKNIR